MCRLLVVRSKQSFEISNHLGIFSKICKDSEEYQGHGWGMYYLDSKDVWKEYKNIKPIWEDELNGFPSTRLLVAHARSAYMDKDIFIENNMPFFDEKYVFMFNGELQKVRIAEEGRIGAEKIFNFIKRFDKGDMMKALETGVKVLKKRAEYFKAINIIISTKDKIYLSTNYNEREHYFSVHFKEDDKNLIICSMPYADGEGWKKIPNNTNLCW